jgi:hypothetical protein
MKTDKEKKSVVKVRIDKRKEEINKRR